MFTLLSNGLFSLYAGNIQLCIGFFDARTSNWNARLLAIGRKSLNLDEHDELVDDITDAIVITVPNDWKCRRNVIADGLNAKNFTNVDESDKVDGIRLASNFRCTG
jgi:hypothetical protein